MASLVTRNWYVRALFFGTTLIAAVTAVRAEDFRIETKIYIGDAKEPASEATTLFVGKAVYDFIAEPEQVAVFRQPVAGKPGRFILLDPVHNIKTEVSTAQLAGAMEKLRTWAGRQTDPFLQFAANPQFKESFESGSGKLVLASHVESYSVTTRRAEHPQALAEYREFLDWSTRLNTLLSAGPPPEPRLRLNESLDRHKVIPLKVELTHNGEKEPIRAEHQFIWRLSNDDRARINDVGTSLSSYRPVLNEEFLQATRTNDAAE
ncbi:MAG: hypothetical protein WD468_03805 [Pirellulales bacterium]